MTLDEYTSAVRFAKNSRSEMHIPITRNILTMIRDRIEFAEFDADVASYAESSRRAVLYECIIKALTEYFSMDSTTLIYRKRFRFKDCFEVRTAKTDGERHWYIRFHPDVFDTESEKLKERR